MESYASAWWRIEIIFKVKTNNTTHKNNGKEIKILYFLLHIAYRF